VKKRKLAESITNEMKEHEANQVSKILCTPTEGTDDTAVINLVVEDTEEKELVEYRFKVTPKMVEERVKAMKDYLVEIAGVPPSEDTPLPHLERHQAWLLLGGYQKHYKNLPGNLRFGRQHMFLLHLPRCNASFGKPFQGKTKT